MCAHVIFLNSFTSYTDGMFQSKFPFEDNKVLSYVCSTVYPLQCTPISSNNNNIYVNCACGICYVIACS